MSHSTCQEAGLETFVGKSTCTHNSIWDDKGMRSGC